MNGFPGERTAQRLWNFAGGSEHTVLSLNPKKLQILVWDFEDSKWVTGVRNKSFGKTDVFYSPDKNATRSPK